MDSSSNGTTGTGGQWSNPNDVAAAVGATGQAVAAVVGAVKGGATTPLANGLLPTDATGLLVPGLVLVGVLGLVYVATRR